MNLVDTEDDFVNFEYHFFQSVYEKLPNDKRLISILAELYTCHGEIEKGLELDRKLVEIDETNATAHYNLACSLSLNENFEEANIVVSSLGEYGEPFEVIKGKAHGNELVNIELLRKIINH